MLQFVFGHPVLVCSQVKPVYQVWFVFFVGLCLGVSQHIVAETRVSLRSMAPAARVRVDTIRHTVCHEKNKVLTPLYS